MSIIKELIKIREWEIKYNGNDAGFSWPTDGCSYETHCLLVDLREETNNLESAIYRLKLELYKRYISKFMSYHGSIEFCTHRDIIKMLEVTINACICNLTTNNKGA